MAKARVQARVCATDKVRACVTATATAIATVGTPANIRARAIARA